MNEFTTMRAASGAAALKVRIGELVGAGDKIGRLLVPFLAAGVGLNLWRPAFFSVGGPSEVLRSVSIVALAVGAVVWAWSAALILVKVPRHELITSGPFALVKHPLYTGVGLLVLPFGGFLIDTWLGALLGAVLYIAARMYAPEEERALAETFGASWDEYASEVKVPWL